MKSILLIHTVPMTIETIGRYIYEKNQKIMLENFLDEHILFLLKSNREKEAIERLIKILDLAREAKKDKIMIVCSSLGTLLKKIEKNEDVLLIDEKMLEQASKNSNILVVATAKTTLEPTVNRILEKRKDVKIETLFVEDAINEYKLGNRKKHDEYILDSIKEKVKEKRYDVVVLSQVSMGHLKMELENYIDTNVLNSIDSLLDNI